MRALKHIFALTLLLSFSFVPGARAAFVYADAFHEDFVQVPCCGVPFPIDPPRDPSGILDLTFDQFTDLQGRALAVTRPTRLVQIGNDTFSAPIGSIGMQAQAEVRPISNPVNFRSLTRVEGAFGDTARFSFLPDQATQISIGMTLDAEFEASTPNARSRIGTTGSLAVEMNAEGSRSTASLTFDGSSALNLGFLINGRTSGVIPGANGFVFIDDAIMHLNVPITPQMRATREFEFDITFLARATAEDFGLNPKPAGELLSMETNALNTLTFSSLTFGFADGSEATPESLGIDLSFESGLVSPNVEYVVVVPEPSSLATLGIGVFSLVSLGVFRQLSRTLSFKP